MNNPNADSLGIEESLTVDLPVFPLPPLVDVPHTAAVSATTKKVQRDYPFISMPPIFPMPGPPRRPNPQSNESCKVRFFHAAANYGPVTISVGSKIVATNLAYGNVSYYAQVEDGFHIVTVMSTDSQGTVLLRKEMPFRKGDIMTIAIINTANGLGLEELSDRGCSKLPYDLSCFRVINLSYNSMPIYTLLDNDRMIFQDINFKEATSLKRISPDTYNFIIAETTYTPKIAPVKPDSPNALLSEDSIMPGYGDLTELLPLKLEVKPNVMYSIYIIGLVDGSPELQAVVIENPLT